MCCLPRGALKACRVVCLHDLQSDSDYNPVEEPTWLQEPAGSFDLGASPAGSPRIMAYGVQESTAVASPARRPKAALRSAGGDGMMEEIVSFVRDKVRFVTSFPVVRCVEEQQPPRVFHQQTCIAEICFHLWRRGSSDD